MIKHVTDPHVFPNKISCNRRERFCNETRCRIDRSIRRKSKHQLAGRRRVYKGGRTQNSAVYQGIDRGERQGRGTEPAAHQIDHGSKGVCLNAPMQFDACFTRTFFHDSAQPMSPARQNEIAVELARHITQEFAAHFRRQSGPELAVRYRRKPMPSAMAS